MEIKLEKPIESLELNSFYEFYWKIVESDDERGYTMTLADNPDFQPINPKQLVDRLYKVWANCDPTISNQMKNTMKMVSTQLTASSDGTFIYELLQNANDYPIEDADGNAIPVDVEFHITGDYLIYRHSGDYFSPRNIAAISKLAAGEKKALKNAIGYKGIGFKTIFNGNDYAYLRTGSYSLRFDESSRISRDDPWQIMPIWTDPRTINPKVKQLFDKGEGRFRVQMAIRPKDQSMLRGEDKKAYNNLFLDIFKDEKDILFVPNLRSVQIFIDGLPKKKCTKRSNNWVLTYEPYKYVFDEKEIAEINAEVLASDGKIPDKYRNFEDTRVMFACCKKDNNLSPVENATVSCYLPTLAQFGFPFMFNTDMIPTGPRDNIELKIELNKRFANIAGQKFVEWIRDLVKSGEYEYKSIFDLIPNFDYCREHHQEYKDFITEFENGFKQALNSIPIVPVIENGERTIKLLSEVLYDESGITYTNVMTDDEFMTFHGKCYLVDKGLRYYDDLTTINKFKHLHEKFKKISFTDQNLLNFCDNVDFCTWIKGTSNNSRFINFIYRHRILNSFISKSIFLNEDDEGKLFPASSLFFYVAPFRRVLPEYKKQLNCLATETRRILTPELLSGIPDCRPYFKSFNPTSFLDSVVFTKENMEEAIKQLSSKERSISFVRLLAEYVVLESKYKFLPFYDSEENKKDNYDRIVYFHTKEAETIINSVWFDKSLSCLISPDYFTKDEEFNEKIKDVLKKCGVKDYSDKSLINDVILNDVNLTVLTTSVSKDLETNLFFVRFLYINKQYIEDDKLSRFPLYSQDSKGNDTWHPCNTEEKIFFNTEDYNKHAAKKWITNTMMYSINDNYVTSLIDTNKDNQEDQKKEIKSFYQDKFGIKKFSQANFYYFVLSKKSTDIYGLLTDKTIILDFYQYLTDNFETLFEGSGNIRGEKTFAEMPYINGSGIVVSAICSTAVKFLYNADLDVVSNETWLPKGLVITASPDYDKIGNKVLAKLGFTDYSMTSFFNSVIWNNKTAIIGNISTFENNVAFHKFMTNHRKDIAEKDLKEKMPSFPVFIASSSEKPTISQFSSGHNLSTPDILKFIDSKILSMEDINVIDKEYMISGAVDYWSNLLQCSSFDHTKIKSLLTVEKFSILNAYAINNANNLNLWKTIKEVFDKDDDLKEFRVLPVVAHNQLEGAKSTWIYPQKTPKTYISDAYRKEKGTDAQLKTYDPNDSYIIDELYLEGNSDKASEWFELWKKVGLKYEISEILIGSILDKLSTFTNFDLPGVLLNNREILKSKGWDIDKFTSLKVLTDKLGYKEITNALIIKSDETEPMVQVKLPQQLSDNYSSEVKKFILEIAEKANSKNIVSTTDEWVNQKIQYIKMVMGYINSTDITTKNKARTIYVDCLNELIKYCSMLYEKNELQKKSYSSTLNEFLLKGVDGNFYSGSNLTFGMAYLPKASKSGACDFQSNGITTGLHYLSEEYKSYEKWTVIRDFLKAYMNVQYKFEEKHIPLLSNHQFCLYFWSQYISMPGVIGTVTKLITDKKITETTNCIPTAEEVCCAQQLYSRKAIGNMVKRIPEIWPKLICADTVPTSIGDQENPIDSISGYKVKLSAQHCLLYLANSDPSHTALRKDALNWILEDKTSISNTDIDTYRNSETSYWINCEKEKKLLRDMCVIDPSDSYIKQHFSTDPHILQETAFPDGKVIEICNILHIDILSKRDSFIPTPLDSHSESMHCKEVLNRKSLLLAAIFPKEGIENWQEAYKTYKANIEQCSFINCGAIELTCRLMPEIKNDDAIMFYWDADKKTFFYVEKWQGKVFYNDFVNACVEALEIPSKSDFTLVGNILDEDLSTLSLSKIVNRYCALYLEEEEFRNELLSIYPELKGKLLIHENVSSTDNSYENPAETSITTKVYDKTDAGQNDETYNADFREEDPLNNEADNLSHNDSNDKKDNPTDMNHASDIPTRQEEAASAKDGTATNSDEKNGEESKSISKDGDNDSGSTANSSEGSESPANNSENKHSINSGSINNSTSSSNSSYKKQEYQNTHSEKEDLLKRRTRRPQRSVFDEEDSIAEIYKPKVGQADITDWKKTQQQIELGVADPNNDELEACRSFIDGSKDDKEIIDEQYLSRYRLYNYLTNEEKIEIGDQRDFINNKSKNLDIQTNKGYIHARSAKGGILFVSSTLWKKLNEHGHRLCMYYGNKGSEFKLIDNVEELIKLVGDDNIIVQVKGKEKYETIQSIFSGNLKENSRAYVLIRIKSNERYNALFVNIYTNDDENNVDF